MLQYCTHILVEEARNGTSIQKKTVYSQRVHELFTLTRRTEVQFSETVSAGDPAGYT